MVRDEAPHAHGTVGRLPGRPLSQSWSRDPGKACAFLRGGATTGVGRWGPRLVMALCLLPAWTPAPALPIESDTGAPVAVLQRPADNPLTALDYPGAAAVPSLKVDPDSIGLVPQLPNATLGSAKGAAAANTRQSRWQPRGITVGELAGLYFNEAPPQPGASQSASGHRGPTAPLRLQPPMPALFPRVDPLEALRSVELGDDTVRVLLDLFTPVEGHDRRTHFSILGMGDFALFKNDRQYALRMVDPQADGRQSPLEQPLTLGPAQTYAEGAAAAPQDRAGTPDEPLTITAFLRHLLGDWYSFLTHPLAIGAVLLLLLGRILADWLLRVRQRRRQRKSRRKTRHQRRALPPERPAARPDTAILTAPDGPRFQ